MPPYPYPDGRGRSVRLEPGMHISYGGRPRSRSRGRGDSPPSINIYNNNDAYQEGPYQDARDQYAPRGRSAQRYDPGYGYGYPMVAPPPNVVPIVMPGYDRRRSHSRHSSRSSGRSRSHSKPYYEEEEWRKRVIADAKRKEEAEEKEKERAIENYRFEKEKEDREEKEAQAEAVRQYEQNKKDAAEKEKAAWEAYEAKRKKQEQDKKDAEKKADDEYKERMRKHLAKCGYAPNQIDTIIEMESMKLNDTPGTLVHQPRNAASGKIVPGVRAQIYPKIRRADIAEETLKYYKLDWEHCREDPNYIVILQEMTEKETDVLFAHTERLRAKGGGKVLQIEERKDKGKEPQLLLVRRKSKNERGRSGDRSRDRSRDRSAVRGIRFAGGVLGV